MMMSSDRTIRWKVASCASTKSSLGQTLQFAEECALKETAVINLIEDHGAAEDLPADRWATPV
jgi:hypothetical protein